ncbi:hypothetical protein BHE74_00017643 [Ensete ventricosum]|nr:hypothetical protein GW17_00007534 [Ensete ventricosum]RWW74423.1 hypothetical protein BHE74_00017643 [Ensete ventricosum]
MHTRLTRVDTQACRIRALVNSVAIYIRAGWGGRDHSLWFESHLFLSLAFQVAVSAYPSEEIRSGMGWRRKRVKWRLRPRLGPIPFLAPIRSGCGMGEEEVETEATACADPLPSINCQHTWTYVRGKFVSTMTTADGPRLGSSSCRDGGYLIRPPTVDGLRFGSSSHLTTVDFYSDISLAKKEQTILLEPSSKIRLDQTIMTPQDQALVNDANLELVPMNLKEGDHYVVNYGEGLTVLTSVAM